MAKKQRKKAKKAKRRNVPDTRTAVSKHTAEAELLAAAVLSGHKAGKFAEMGLELSPEDYIPQKGDIVVCKKYLAGGEGVVRSVDNGPRIATVYWPCANGSTPVSFAKLKKMSHVNLRKPKPKPKPNKEGGCGMARGAEGSCEGQSSKSRGYIDCVEISHNNRRTDGFEPPLEEFTLSSKEPDLGDTVVDRRDQAVDQVKGAERVRGQITFISTDGTASVEWAAGPHSYVHTKYLRVVRDRLTIGEQEDGKDPDPNRAFRLQKMRTTVHFAANRAIEMPPVEWKCTSVITHNHCSDNIHVLEEAPALRTSKQATITPGQRIAIKKELERTAIRLSQEIEEAIHSGDLPFSEAVHLIADLSNKPTLYITPRQVRDIEAGESELGRLKTPRRDLERMPRVRAVQMLDMLQEAVNSSERR